MGAPTSLPGRSGSRAVVTGASSGIGREVAISLARRGYELVLIARRAEKLEELREELSKHAPATVLSLDLARREDLDGALEELSGGAPVDVLVNNAGVGLYVPFLEHSGEDFRRLMEVHYFASVSFIRAVLPGMVERGRGHVINIASIATKVGPWGHSGYAASKSALVALTQSLAAEYAGTPIHFSYVNPGIVKTEYFDHPSYATLRHQVRRHGISAGSTAKKIVALLDRPRLELCIPRHYRILDWIKAISPSLAHRMVTRQSRPPTDREQSGPGTSQP